MKNVALTLPTLTMLMTLAASGCASAPKIESRSPSNAPSIAAPKQAAATAAKDPVDTMEDVSKLSDIEQAEYFAKKGQIDSAIVHYEYALTDHSWSSKSGPAWSAGFKKMMTLVLEEKKSPSLALELVSKISASGAVPAAYSNQVKTMKSQLKAMRSSKGPDFAARSKQMLLRLPASG